MFLRFIIILTFLCALLQLTFSDQKPNKYIQQQSKLKVENDDDVDLINEHNKNLNLPVVKSKASVINKMIKASKIDLGSKKFNQKDFKSNKTNIEFIKNGNKTIVRDKDSNQTLEEISDEEFGNQHWYWWG